MRFVHFPEALRTLLIGTIISVIGPIAPAAAQTIESFDPAGSIATYVYAINKNSVVTGAYSDSSHVWHGFVRSAKGAMTRFSVTGATATIAN
ncbi:MAG TPA: hypothetical protein VKR31_03620, partial [Rhizomicrobium sp.]|nr:hypothetical protein [Rhizomicrobium sp.]